MGSAMTWWTCWEKRVGVGSYLVRGAAIEILAAVVAVTVVGDRSIITTVGT